MKKEKTMAEWMCDLMCGTEEEAIEEDILCYANYMIDHDLTVREMAQEFSVPQTTMYRYLTEDLKHLDDDLYARCQSVMHSHKHKRTR